MAEADRRFRFVQLEFPWALGPDDGRYVLREPDSSEPSHVLVLRTLGAPQRRLLGRRRPRSAEPEPEPSPVATTRATVVGAESMGAEEAEAWLSGLDPGSSAAAIAEALRAVNRALRAHRSAAADSSVNDVSADQALIARLGYGSGEQVAEGRWDRAVEVSLEDRRRQRRTAALRPQERLAAMLGGRDAALACEELTLRARGDMAAGREREAALQLRVALEAAIAELGRFDDGGDLDERVEELRAQRSSVAAAANEALDGPLSPASVNAVEHVLGRLEAALRARAAAGKRATGRN